MSALPLIFTAGWASGVNAYAVVLLLGLLGRFGFADSVPDALQRTDVLIAAAVLFAIEAVADKIPYLDSFWDVLHTVVRPASGAVVAALIAGQDGSLSELAAGALGGTTALVSHLVKAGTRMAINTSPEPASNVVMSVAEDSAVAGIVTLAVFHPLPAALVAGTLLVLGVVLVLFLATRIRRYLRRRRERRAQRAVAT
ncbi:DUF4126 domain-containing protein [Nocardia altamirensis]|uniref:DUF4126 domain-containing protein n=1 Tax=Nocardia altamirensis TaxID=472158 RepID=UPI0008401CA2|nr:DUF4126 domain-containing protein [Nocardia altamirensis]